MWLATFRLAVRNLLLHKLRSFLTLLGTILGVASVIAMLAVGEGSKREALEQIERLGANNVIIHSIKPQPQNNDGSQSTTTTSSVLAYGLTFADLRRIEDLGLEGAMVVPSVMHRKNVQHGKSFLRGIRVVGTTDKLPAIKSLKIRGRFINESDCDRSANVAVLGHGIASELFGFEDPLEQSVLVGIDAYRVIGVLGERGEVTTSSNGQSEDRNREILIPITAAEHRMGLVQRIVQTGSRQYERIELSDITVAAKDSEQVRAAATMIRNILEQNHGVKRDYEVQVPLELLAQAEREKRLWNLVLGSIAGISLLVGGIGIMNIMLATVTERTREIGIRRAIGAKRRDIVTQFLMETTVLSTTGGLLGVILGVTLPLVVTYFLGIETLTSLWSIGLAFGISVLTGIVFGVYPAYKAARMNPIEALRQ